MQIDGNIGGSIDGTAGANFDELRRQVALADEIGYDGVWSTEVARDPFLPLLLAAEHSPRLQVGTAIAVAFARNPMTLATVANDLQSFASGRLLLGLGSQIKPHIERRFGMPWSEPARRMREFVCALRAIWESWQTDTPLDFRGDFYTHTLMTPMFRPPRNEFGSPPVLIAAVGQRMTSVAAEVADGIQVHGFTTERYLREVTVPLLRAGREATGKTLEDFVVSYPGLVVTGSDERQFEDAAAAVRKQIAFYGSTPAYRAVLDLHGWGDLHTELNRLSKLGDWSTMSALIDDTVLRTFAVVGEPGDVAAEITRRFDGVVSRFTLYTPYRLDTAVQQAVTAGIRHHRSIDS